MLRAREFGEEIRATDELCRTDPIAAGVREALVLQEAVVHAAGWGDEGMLGHSTKVFTMLTNDRSEVVFRWSGTHSASLTAAAAKLDGVGRALVALAMAAERVRNEGVPAEATGNGKALPPPPADMDLAAYPGLRYLGTGLMSEAWAVVEDADDHTGRDMASRGRLSDHPRRVELRIVNLVCRDGRLWQVKRMRSDTPFVHVHDLRSPKGLRFTGHGLNGLCRLVNATAAGADIPVPSACAGGER